jgi:small subunit ribosomal protein S2
MKQDGSFDALSKREKLQINRQREKLEKNLGSISDMTRLPGALFVVDIKKEHIAVAEAQKLNIPIFAMVDTNSDPRLVDYVIPANDDASKSIDKVLSFVTNAIAEGLSDRKSEKEKVAKKEEAKTEEAPKAAAPEAAAPKAKEVKAEKAPKAKAEKAPKKAKAKKEVTETPSEETK